MCLRGQRGERETAVFKVGRQSVSLEFSILYGFSLSTTSGTSETRNASALNECVSAGSDGWKTESDENKARKKERVYAHKRPSFCIFPNKNMSAKGNFIHSESCCNSEL